MKKLFLCSVLILMILGKNVSNMAGLEDSFRISGMGICNKNFYGTQPDGIEVMYPVFTGKNKERYEEVNQLIEEDVFATINKAKESVEKDHPGTPIFAYWEYEIKYLSDSFISIVYQGRGPSVNITSRCFRTINIDTNEAKKIEISDIVKDEDAVYNLLATDQFESITRWEGVKGNYYFSDPHSPFICSIPPDPGLKGGRYYISEDNFVFVVVSGREFYEYAIALDKIKEYLNEDILKKIPLE